MNIFLVFICIVVLAVVVFLVMKKLNDKKGSSNTTQKLAQEYGENTVNWPRKDAKAIVDSIKDKLKGIKEEILGSGELSYEEAMKYFIVHKDDSPEIAKGALLKEAAGDGFVITQVFLDKNNNLIGADKQGKPLGGRIKVKGLDSELLNLFKDKDLVIVE